MLGGGRRAGTIRARVRPIRKFVAWLAAAHELPYPTTHMHLVEFLQVRHSEPCPRGAMKLTHAASDEAQPVFYRIMAWWLMLQSWGTLRFADHRRLQPRNVRFEAGAFIAKLTRSKTWELINLSVHGSSLSIRRRIFETEAGSWTGGIYSRQKRPTKGTTFFQHPVEITKEFNAENYDTTQHLQSKRDCWDHYSIVGPGSSTCLSLISGALTAVAISYRQ